MQLIVSRNQQDVKGMLGGHKGVQFTLSYRLELTEDELALVSRYKLEDYAVTWRTFQGQKVPDDTIGNMRTGRSQTLTDATTLVRNA
jgi:hypothetical protein